MVAPSEDEREAAKRHVAFVVHSLAWGGIERLILAQGRDLLDRGHRVSILCLTEKGPMEAPFREAGLTVISFGGTSSSSLRHGLANLRAFFRLFLYLRREEVHAVQTQMFYAGVIGRIAAMLAGVAVIVHGEHNQYPWKGWLARRLDRWLAHRSTALVVPSKSVADYLSRQLALPLSTITVIPNGLALPAASREREGLRRSWHVMAENRVIGMCARLVPQKGHALFLRALARLVETRSDVHAVFMGDGPEEAPLRALTSELGLEERVHFLGTVPRPEEFYPALDLLVAPSQREGFGLSVAEALLAECPVLLSDIPPFREVFGDTGCAFVPLGVPALWADAMASLLDDPEERARLARAGRRLVSERHSADAMLSSYRSLYEVPRRSMVEGLWARV